MIQPVFWLILFFATASFGQHNSSIDKIVNLTFKNLLKVKTETSIYEFGWLPNSYQKVPCFRDYRNGTIKSQLVNSDTGAVLDIPETPKRTSLEVLPHLLSINLADSTFIINGRVFGAWAGVTPNEFQIYVGHRVDTISDLKLRPSLEGDVFYNGDRVTETIVVNTVPAFYMKNFQNFKCYRGQERFIGSPNDEMYFQVSSKIDDNSIFVIALSSTYAEMFEVGKLLEVARKKKQRKN
jgi:hypothetical protein